MTFEINTGYHSGSIAMHEIITINAEVSGVEVAGLFDPASEASLTVDQRILIASLLASNARVDVAIPDSIGEGRLWEAFELCCRVFVRVRQASGQLKLLIGRALILIKDSPKIFESRGFDSFDSFMTRADGLPGITGISRSELYKAKTVAERAPALALADARQIGFTKLGLITQVTREGHSDFGRWIGAAKTLTIPQLKEEIYRSNHQIASGSLEYGTLHVPVTLAEKAEIDEWFANPQTQAVAGQSPGGIIVRMIQECRTEWAIEGSALIELAGKAA